MSEKTIANLEAAVALETETAKRYAEYAEIAKSEGVEAAADLFEELGRVKELHADILKSSSEDGGDSEGGCGPNDCGDCTGGCA
jgi:rubrerythrin